jgi:hypothetical protein
MRLLSVLLLWLLIPGAAIVSAQAVLSTHSGLLNFTEGAVLLDDQPLTPKFGTFTNIPEGSTLRTEKGRAEILLTPGAFLRIDENSAIRMISNDLAHTRIEFLRGAAILDTNEAAPNAPLVLTFKSFEVRFPKQGVYRLDSDPAVFETYSGAAEIRGEGGQPKTIDETHEFFFGIGMETNRYGEGAVDTFSEWARNRAETIAADNRAAALSTSEPPDPGASPFGGPVLPVIPPLAGGGTAGTVIVQNYVYNPYGFNPYGGLNGNFLYPENPFFVVYLVPRFWGHRNPVYGTPPLQPRGPHGYPVLPPARAGNPRPLPLRPTPIPLTRPGAYAGAGYTQHPSMISRPSFTRPAFVHPGFVRPGFVAPHVAVAPPRLPAPMVARPGSPAIGIRHR